MLHAIATHAGTVIRPPRVIDVTWHMLILHTPGRRFHRWRRERPRLRDFGYEIDEELWAMVEATKCETACSGCDNKVLG